MRIRSSAALLIATLAATALMASCAAPRVECDYAADAGTFVGRVEKTRGSTVTYVVERLQAEPASAPAKLHSPIEGEIVAVHYERHEDQFLRAGQRYLVTVWWVGRYFSGVHMANHPCSIGTVHADGSAIDTGLVHQPHLRQVLDKILVAMVGVGLLITVWAIRRRRRQRKSVEELLRLAS
ncbi:MAG: hypothetical protein QOG50_1422 [Actinomycetota bacterium]|nr:hypothetical protein [Actinomycetota bacterium]